MKLNRFTDEAKIRIVKEFESGVNVKEICRKYGMSDVTLYTWRKKFHGFQISEAKKFKQLEDENRRLKKLVADQALDLSALKEIVAKKL